MNCPNCQSANPDDARFCMNCGKALALTCPNCGSRLPAGARFCLKCGQPMAGEIQPPAEKGQQAPNLASRTDAPDSRLQPFIPKELLAKLESARASGTLEGERRVVTMLFCDVQGSTAAASQLDPEEWTEIIQGAFEHMIRPVYHYEGTVARLMGDGLLAFFGAPIAHEDDPQRAVLAGLQILEEIRSYRQEVARRWGIDFDVRVGINTGLVVVGAVGSDLRMEYTALGDAINLAARMEQTAQPGTIQVSEATYKLVAPLFDFEVLESVDVKGRSTPLQVYRVLGKKAKPGRLRGIAGLEAPLIGRSREMETLQTAIRDLQQGRGQILSVMGEAGLGKSRLVAEAKVATKDEGRTTKDERRMTKDEGEDPSSLVLRPSSVLWLEGRSLSYETSTPYAPFVDLFSHLFGLGAGQAEAEKYGQIKGWIAARWPECAEDLSPYLAVMLGVAPVGADSDRVKYLEPPTMRSLIFTNVRVFFERLATKQPLVLVFEDVHWIDPTSLDLLESLLPLTDRGQILILAVFRPRRQEPSWRFHETASRAHPHRYTAIALQPLGEGEARALVGNLLHIEDLPEKVRSLILERAEGNPFFVEEMIRSLLDAGLVVRENERWRAVREIENIAIPDTLIGVITARLDRLGDTARRAAQAAAVIGRDFDFEVLADLLEGSGGLETSLADLQRRELIREKERQPRRIYLFKHVLTQEAAYSSILLSQRRELHQRAGESLERRQPELSADIARHYLEARLPARAAPFLVEAGDKASRAYSIPEAIGYYSKLLELRNSLEDRQLVRRAYEGLGNALTFANQVKQALETYQAMLSLAEQEEDISMQVSALNKLANVLALRSGQFQEAESYLARAEKLAHGHKVKDGIVEMSILRCQMCTAKADFDGVIAYMGEVVNIGRDESSKEHLAMGLEHVSASLMFLTRFEEAWQKGQEALAVAREIGDREHEAWLLVQTVAMVLVSRGELDAAAQAAENGVRISERIGAREPQIYGNWILGEIARWRGEYEQAIAYGQRSLEAALPVEEFMPFMTVQPLGSLGTTYLEISGHFTDEVARFHQHALRLLETPAGAAGGGTAWADLGFCQLLVGDLDTAELTFQKGLDYPTMFMLVERPRHLLGLAQAALARGEVDHAMRLVEEARAYAQEREMRHLYPLIALISAHVQTAQGETEVALAQYGLAEELAADLGMRPIALQAQAGAAQILSGAGRAEEAEAKHRATRAMIDEIAGMFTDEKLRETYLKSVRGWPPIRPLLSRMLPGRPARSWRGTGSRPRSRGQRGSGR